MAFRSLRLDGLAESGFVHYTIPRFDCVINQKHSDTLRDRFSLLTTDLISLNALMGWEEVHEKINVSMYWYTCIHDALTISCFTFSDNS